MSDDRPVTMQNLVCVGGFAHGERADIPSNNDWVCVAERRRLRIRPDPCEDVVPSDAMFRCSRYRRRRVGNIQVLLCVDTHPREVDNLLRGLFKERKLP